MTTIRNAPFLANVPSITLDLDPSIYLALVALLDSAVDAGIPDADVILKAVL